MLRAISNIYLHTQQEPKEKKHFAKFVLPIFFLNDFSALHRNLDTKESLSDPQLICDIIHL